MQTDVEELSKKYRLNDEQFEEYKKMAWITLATGKRTSKDKTLIIVGGQSGAGKSKLIPLAFEELQQNAVIVDFDELRALHPYYEEVSEKYTEITHRILHADTEKVKNVIMQRLMEEGYNVIYEGALRNTQGFIDFARDFKECKYNVKMYIMAVPKLESFGSTFGRFAKALADPEQKQIPRWVEKVAHDGAYEGVTRTVRAFIDEGMTDDVHCFVRGNDTPRIIYTTEGRQYRDALEAIECGREMGRKKAVIDFPENYERVTALLSEKQPETLPKLVDWRTLYEEEVQYFAQINRGSEFDD